MTDHHELVAEMASIERMPTQDRLKHARKRRSQQLKKWNQYEKQLDKESKKKKTAAQQNSIQKQRQRKSKRVKFESSISLLESAARNDIDEVRILLQNKTDPNVTNEDGLTALHQCCIDDNNEMLQLLLDYGANVNAKDSELWTPLHAAATCGHVHLCKQLVERGAELLAVNADGNMPYDICEDEVTLDYIETEMSKRGITQEEIDETRLATERRMLEDLKAVGSDRRALEKRLDGGVTPLHIAAANGYLEVADYLLSSHVTINMRDDDSWQPLHAAAYWGQPEMLELLVQNGADLDAKTRNGETAFDLCEDPEMKQKILDMKDEIETTRNNRLPSKKHRVSSRSASIRRSSLRGEKTILFKKEAREEALHFGLRTMEDDDDLADDEDAKEHLPATNIDDVTLILPSDDRNHDDHADHADSRDGLAVKPSNPPSTKHAPVPASVRKEEAPRQLAHGQSQAAPHPKPVVTNKPQQVRHASESRQGSESRPADTRSGTGSRPDSAPPGDPGPSSRVPPTQPNAVPVVTLADLKKIRKEERVVDPPPPPRQKTVDDHVQDMFLSNLQKGPVMPPNSHPRTSVKDKTQNGHNNNNRNSMSSSNRNTYPPEDGRLKSYKTHAVIGGDEEKDTRCCVIS